MYTKNRFLSITLFLLTAAFWFLAACQPVSTAPTTAVADVDEVTSQTATAVATATPEPTIMLLQPTETAVVIPTVALTMIPTIVAIEPTAVATTTPAELPIFESTDAAATAGATIYWVEGKVYFDTAVILDIPVETGCFGNIAPDISHSPNWSTFLLIPGCFEGDNHLFLFQADGTGKLQLTSRFEYINYSEVAWAADSRSFTYTRLNSCCLSPSDIPMDAPQPGQVQYVVATGEKILLTPPHEFLVQVVNVAENDTLNVRTGAGIDNPIVGQLPQGDLDIYVTGSGEIVDQTVWLPIRYQDLTGWVNSAFLVRQDR